MKYRYLTTIVAAAIIAIAILVYKNSGSSYDTEQTSQSIQDADYAIDIGRTLNLLVTDNPIPRLPLKDLFSDPEAKKREELRLAKTKVRQTHLPKVSETKKISTTPHLIGIVIRHSESKAFFVDNDKTYSLRRGDVLAGRYRITEIASDKVNIREMSTGLRRTIYVKDE